MLQKRVRMEAGRIGGCEKREMSVKGAESPIPLSRFPKGKAGAGGFPPRRRKTAAPPTRGPAPLCDPPDRIATFLLTTAGLLMEAATNGSGCLKRTEPRPTRNRDGMRRPVSPAGCGKLPMDTHSKCKEETGT